MSDFRRVDGCERRGRGGGFGGGGGVWLRR